MKSITHRVEMIMQFRAIRELADYRQAPRNRDQAEENMRRQHQPPKKRLHGPHHG